MHKCVDCQTIFRKYAERWNGTYSSVEVHGRIRVFEKIFKDLPVAAFDRRRAPRSERNEAHDPVEVIYILCGQS